MAQNIKKWSDDQIKTIWKKARAVPGYDSSRYRQDITGAWIEYSKYGNTDNELGFGWEIDHRFPEELGGTDDEPNLRPLQWRNNRAKSDNYPEWTSVVSSDGDINVRKTKHWSMR